MDNEEKLFEAMEALKRQLSSFEANLFGSFENATEYANAITNAVGDAIKDAIADAVEDAVTDAVGDAVSQHMPAVGARPAMYLLSQDQKALVPFVSASARRVKQGEEPYAIWICSGPNTNRYGVYPDKAAALAEIRRLADALQRGDTYYEMH